MVYDNKTPCLLTYNFNPHKKEQNNNNLSNPFTLKNTTNKNINESFNVKRFMKLTMNA